MNNDTTLEERLSELPATTLKSALDLLSMSEPLPDFFGKLMRLGEFTRHDLVAQFNLSPVQAQSVMDILITKGYIQEIPTPAQETEAVFKLHFGQNKRRRRDRNQHWSLLDE